MTELDEYHTNRLQADGLERYIPDMLALATLYEEIAAVHEDEGNFGGVNFDDMILGFFLARGITADLNDREVEPPAFHLRRITEWWRWDK